MDKKVKLAYIYLLKYDISPTNWKKNDTTTADEFMTLIEACLKSEQHDLDILDIIDFMKQYEREQSILKL
jgi:hypothetical protein